MHAERHMVSEDTRAAPIAPSLEPLYRLIQEDLSAVNDLLLARVAGQVPLILEVARHILQGGGKRIRPAVMLISAQACGYTGTEHRKLAAAVELLHTATLLHDDVIDASTLRRGKATANETFGNKASILVGDFLLSQAFQWMVAADSLEGLRLLADAAAVISQGEVLQLAHQGSLALSQEDHLAILHAKTAVLFGTATELGAIIADRPEARAPLATYGHALGMAFQLIDDALDYAGDVVHLGKAVGDDFREGKVTLPVLIAYREGDTKERAFWERTIARGEQREEDLAQAQAYLCAHEVRTRVYQHANDYAKKAKEALCALPPSPATEAMGACVDFCLHRTF